jgi:hypothetical protein
MRLQVIVTGAAALILGLAACGQRSEQQPAAEAESAAATLPAPEPSALPRTSSPEGARVFFITPADGDTVSNPVSIEFGIEGMDVVKAGNDQPHSGHHHLLIDTDLPDLGAPIPADAQHVHFGDGSTATEIMLPPGPHKLQMLLGDHRHIPHDPAVVSELISINVE